jgi:Spy/CpxP family protein refolding chaperone
MKAVLPWMLFGVSAVFNITFVLGYMQMSSAQTLPITPTVSQPIEQPAVTRSTPAVEPKAEPEPTTQPTKPTTTTTVEPEPVTPVKPAAPAMAEAPAPQPTITAPPAPEPEPLATTNATINPPHKLDLTLSDEPRKSAKPAAGGSAANSGATSAATPGGKLELVSKELELNPQQKQMLQHVTSGGREQMMKLMQQRAHLVRQYAHEMSQPRPDRKRLRQMAEQIEEHNKQMRSAASERLADFVGSLSPEQRKKWSQMVMSANP